MRRIINPVVVPVLAAVLLLAACAGSGDDADATTTTDPVGDGGNGAGEAQAAAPVEATTTSSAGVGDAAGSSTAGITVTGVGTVLGRPDTMTVTIGVNVVRPTVSEATAEATASATALFDALQAAGVAEEDIQTQNYSIWPQYRYVEGQVPELTGYQVSNTVLAKIRDVDAAGTVIDAAVAAGGDNSVVQGIGFSVEDDTERLAEARAKAFADARAKAEQLAELAGVELGGVLRMAETLGEQSPLFAAESAGADTASRTPIQPGEVTSEVRVDIVFAIG
ncbi:MAG TPA: SIMPL domain-containing protein [Ilumatobacter sp.]